MDTMAATTEPEPAPDAPDEHFRNHKVVVFPHSRGRTTVRQMAAASNNKASQQSKGVTSPTSPPRTRSLSIGRSRQRSGDIVQDLYDRMGVNLRKGQGMDIIKGSGSGDELESHSSPAPTGGPGSPLGFANADTQNGANMVAETAAAAAAREEIGGENFQERYRNALSSSRGRATQEAEVKVAPRRTRSLSRGQPALLQRWPFAAGGTAAKQDEADSASPDKSNSAAPSPTVGIAAALPKRPPLMLSSPTAKQRISASHSQGLSPNNRSVQLDQSPSWTDSSANGEEKKEDYCTEPNHATPTIKERISAYGKPSGSSVKSTRNSSSGIKRVVDPTYAAQFANRDHPPKIDIFEGKKDEKEDAVEGVVASTSPTGPPSIAPNAEETHSAGVIAPATPVAEDQSAPSPRNKSEPRHFRAGSLANAFLAAINNKQPSLQPSTAMPAPYKDSGSVSLGAPVAEIAVAEIADMLGNDCNSVAGMSTVSGEEFSSAPSRIRAESSKKPAWQEQRNRVSSYRQMNSAAPPSLKPTMGSNHHGHSTHNNNNSTLQGNLDRMVEERVQVRVAEMEARIEQKLRTLVLQMEDKIMQRLDTLEQKMTAAVAKKK